MGERKTIITYTPFKHIIFIINVNLEKISVVFSTLYLDAAAAAADPFHLEMVFSEPFVASTWNTDVVLMPKIVPCGP